MILERRQLREANTMTQRGAVVEKHGDNREGRDGDE